MKNEETTRFEERCRESERQIVQKVDTTAAACKQAEDEPAATSEHAEGHNEATAAEDKKKDAVTTKKHAEKCGEAAAAEDKGRNEAAAAAAAAMKKLDRVDILRSQSDAEDEEIMALIDEKRKIKKNDKKRLKEVRKKIKKSIRDKKRSRREEKIQRILEECKGIKRTSRTSNQRKKGHSSKR